MLSHSREKKKKTNELLFGREGFFVPVKLFYVQFLPIRNISKSLLDVPVCSKGTLMLSSPPRTELHSLKKKNKRVQTFHVMAEKGKSAVCVSIAQDYDKFSHHF
jgi:hypothetical protein